MGEGAIEAVAKVANCVTMNTADATPPTRKRAAEDFPEPESVKRAGMMNELEEAVSLGPGQGR